RRDPAGGRVSLAMEWPWAALSVVLAPAFAFAGAYLGYRRARAADLARDRWRRREEPMRMVRSPAHQALHDDESLRPVGASALDALRRAELREPEGAALVEESAAAVGVVAAMGPGCALDAVLRVSEDGEAVPDD